MTGMPSRVSSSMYFCRRLSARTPSLGAIGRVPRGPRDLSDPEPERPAQDLRIGPVVGGRVADLVIAIRVENQPEGVKLRDLFVEGHSPEQVCGTYIRRKIGFFVGFNHFWLLFFSFLKIGWCRVLQIPAAA